MRIPRRQLQPFTRRWPVGRPAVWAILIAVNLTCFVMQKVVDLNDRDLVETWFGLSAFGVSKGYFWQFITYTFLHAGPLHLIVNMVMLYFAGREIEGLLGPRHLLAIYFGGGLLGGLAQWAFTPLSAPMIGASACVLATLLAFTTILPELELTCLLFFVIPIRLRARTLALIMTGSSAAFLLAPYIGRLLHAPWLIDPSLLLFKPEPGTNVQIAHVAHLAGCFLGWFYVKQLGYGNPLWIQRYFLEKRQKVERLKYMNPDQFISQEIDPILEKISRDGIRSLTRNERRILKMGREKIEKNQH